MGVEKKHFEISPCLSEVKRSQICEGFLGGKVSATLLPFVDFMYIPAYKNKKQKTRVSNQ